MFSVLSMQDFVGIDFDTGSNYIQARLDNKLNSISQQVDKVVMFGPYKFNENHRKIA